MFILVKTSLFIKETAPEELERLRIEKEIDDLMTLANRHLAFKDTKHANDCIDKSIALYKKINYLIDTDFSDKFSIKLHAIDKSKAEKLFSNENTSDNNPENIIEEYAIDLEKISIEEKIMFFYEKSLYYYELYKNYRKQFDNDNENKYCKKSIANFQKTISIFRENFGEVNIAELLITNYKLAYIFAELYANLGELANLVLDSKAAEFHYIKSIRAYQELGAESINSPFKVDLAKALTGLGHSKRSKFGKTNPYLEDSIKQAYYYQQAIGLYKKAGIDSNSNNLVVCNFADTLFHLGHLYRKLDELAEAERLYLESIAIYEKNLQFDSIILPLRMLAGLYRDQENYSASIKTYKKIIRLYENHKDKFSHSARTIFHIQATLWRIATLYNTKKKILLAEKYHNKSIRFLIEQVAIFPFLSNDLNDKCCDYEREYGSVATIIYYKKTLNIIRRNYIHNKDNINLIVSLVNSLFNLGHLFYDLKEFNKAEFYFVMLIKLFIETIIILKKEIFKYKAIKEFKNGFSMKVGILSIASRDNAKIRSDLTTLSSHSMLTEKFIFFYEKLRLFLNFSHYRLAIKYYKNINNAFDKSEHNEFSKIMFDIGDVHSENNEITTAIFFYKKGFRLLKKDKDILFYLRKLQKIAWLYQLKEKWENAEKYYLEIIFLCEERNLSYELAGVLGSLAKIYFLLNNFEKSEFFFSQSLKKYDELIKNEFDSIGIESLIELGDFYYSQNAREKSLRCYEKAIQRFDIEVFYYCHAQTLKRIVNLSECFQKFSITEIKALIFHLIKLVDSWLELQYPYCQISGNYGQGFAMDTITETMIIPIQSIVKRGMTGDYLASQKRLTIFWQGWLEYSLNQNDKELFFYLISALHARHLSKLFNINLSTVILKQDDKKTLLLQKRLEEIELKKASIPLNTDLDEHSKTTYKNLLNEGRAIHSKLSDNKAFFKKESYVDNDIDSNKLRAHLMDNEVIIICVDLSSYGLNEQTPYLLWLTKHSINWLPIADINSVADLLKKLNNSMNKAKNLRSLRYSHQSEQATIIDAEPFDINTLQNTINTTMTSCWQTIKAQLDGYNTVHIIGHGRLVGLPWQGYAPPEFKVNYYSGLQ